MRSYIEKGGPRFRAQVGAYKEWREKLDKTTECSKSIQFTGPRAYTMVNPTATKNIHCHYTCGLYDQPMNKEYRELCKSKQERSANCPIKDAGL